MAGHVFIVLVGLDVPLLLLLLRLRSATPRRAALVVLAAMVGATAGAGVAIGLWFQPTTANIHSGYSSASVGEWVVLAAVGGTLGCVIAALAAWRIAVPHVLAAIAVALAVVGAVGWLWSASRDTIDCDDRPDFCAARFGLGEHD